NRIGDLPGCPGILPGQGRAGQPFPEGRIGASIQTDSRPAWHYRGCRWGSTATKIVYSLFSYGHSRKKRKNEEVLT
ncbi:MAG TPA: hypothetical protein VMT31_06270, partial [Methanomicrobiales archaeon]|nr:hypothetical protein [Methanomicrobiales archaeon]